MTNAATQSATFVDLTTGTVQCQTPAVQQVREEAQPQQVAPQAQPATQPQQPSQNAEQLLQAAACQPVPVAMKPEYIVKMNADDFARLQKSKSRSERLGKIAKQLLIAASVLWVLMTALSMIGVVWAASITS